MKKLLSFGIIVLFASLVIAYTPPDNLNVALVLDTDYTAPDNLNVNLVLADVTPPITDTCSCPGLNQNWEIDHSDACTISDACDLGTGKLSFIGTGTTVCDAVIDTTDLGDPGSGGVLQIDAGCRINID